MRDALALALGIVIGFTIGGGTDKSRPECGTVETVNLKESKFGLLPSAIYGIHLYKGDNVTAVGPTGLIQKDTVCVMDNAAGGWMFAHSVRRR